MTTATEVQVGSAVVTNVEVTIATLAVWHPMVDVYVNPNGNTLANGTKWRVYAVTSGTSALLAEGVFETKNPQLDPQRVLAQVPGAGTSMVLKAVLDVGTTKTAVGGAIVGYNPGEATTPSTVSDTQTHAITANNTTFGFITWAPTVEAIVYAVADPAKAIGTFWEICAILPTFPPIPIAEAFLSEQTEVLFQGVIAGATSFLLRAATVAGSPTSAAITASLVGTSGSGGGGGSGSVPLVELVANQNLVMGNVIQTNSTDKAVLPTTNPVLNPLIAIAIEAVASGTLGHFQTSGPLDPTVFNLGAGLATAVGVNSSGLPVRSTSTTCVSQTNWIGFCDTGGNITIQPTQRTAYWAPDYGMVCDGFTNDLAAFLAMQATVPLASGGQEVWFPNQPIWFSDNLYINRNLRLKGRAGGAPAGVALPNLGTVFLFPAGRGMFADNAAVNTARGGDGGSADYSHINGITFQSCYLIWWHSNTPPSTGGGGPAFNANPGFATGSDQALGNPFTKNIGGQRVDATNYPVGAVMTRGAAANVTCLFRTMTGGKSAGTVPGATTNEPVGFQSTIAGVTFADGTVTWVSEMIIQDYLVGHDYRIGDRVFIQNLSNYYFECVVAGTSTIAQTDVNFQSASYFAGSSASQEEFVDVGSGTLTWRTMTHGPIIFTCNQGRSEDCFARGFTTGVELLSTTGFVPAGSTNFYDFKKWSFLVCGMGFFLQGFNSNGIDIEDCNDFFLGCGRNPFPGLLNGADVGCGANMIKDRSLRTKVRGCYSQQFAGTSPGPAYFADTNSTAVFDCCDSERLYGEIMSGTNTVIRIPFSGIQYAVSGSNLNVVDVATRNIFTYQWRTTTTTNAAFQTLLAVPGPGLSVNSTQRIVVVVEGKVTGNNRSFLTATCVADRGINSVTGAQELGTDTWVVSTWGATNALAGTTFDLNVSGGSNIVRVDNPPNFSVDWSITAQSTRWTT